MYLCSVPDWLHLSARSLGGPSSATIRFVSGEEGRGGEVCDGCCCVCCAGGAAGAAGD